MTTSEKAPVTAPDFPEFQNKLSSTMESALANTDKLLKTALDANQNEVLEALRTNLTSLLKMAEKIDSSTPETLEIPQAICEVFGLYTLVRSCITRVLPSAQNKGISLHIQVMANVPEIVFGDSERLTRELEGILDAVIRDSETGGEIVVVLDGTKHDSENVQIKITIESRHPASEDAVSAMITQGTPFIKDAGKAGSIISALFTYKESSESVPSVSVLDEAFHLPLHTAFHLPEIRPKDGAEILLADGTDSNRSRVAMLLKILGYRPILASYRRQISEFMQKPSLKLALIDDSLFEDGDENLFVCKESKNPVRVIALAKKTLSPESLRRIGADDYLLTPVTLQSLEKLLNIWLRE